MASLPLLKALSCLLAASTVLALKMFGVMLVRPGPRLDGFSCVFSYVQVERPLLLRVPCPRLLMYVFVPCVVSSHILILFLSINAMICPCLLMYVFYVMCCIFSCTHFVSFYQ